MDINTITKEQFDTAYNKYQPNAWTKFIFKYFSKSTEKKDLVLSSTIAYVLALLFILGFIGTVMGVPTPIILTVTLIYVGILIALAIGMFGAMVMNNLRINKIAKSLGVTKTQYNDLVNKFYS